MSTDWDPGDWAPDFAAKGLDNHRDEAERLLAKARGVADYGKSYLYPFGDIVRLAQVHATLAMVDALTKLEERS